MTYEWRERPGDLVGLRGVLFSDSAGHDLIGRVRIAGTTYRVRAWRDGEYNGRLQWRMQLEPLAPDASQPADAAAQGVAP